MAKVKYYSASAGTTAGADTTVDTSVVDTTTTTDAVVADAPVVEATVVEAAVAPIDAPAVAVEETPAPVAPTDEVVAAPVEATVVVEAAVDTATPVVEAIPEAITPTIVETPVEEVTPVIEAPAEVVTPVVIEEVATPVIAQEIPVVVETPVAAPEIAIIPAAIETPAPVETPIVSGTLAPSTTADVGTSIPTAAPIATATYAGTVLADLNAEEFSAEAQALFTRVLTTSGSVAKSALADVLRYVKQMGPSYPHDAQTGSAEQIRLFNTLLNCINNTDADFQLVWAVVLRVVAETKDAGAFNDRLAFRFFPYMALDQSARTAFRNLLSIMTSTAVVSGRATALQQIDFQKALGKHYTDAGKNRLLSFYNV